MSPQDGGGDVAWKSSNDDEEKAEHKARNKERKEKKEKKKRKRETSREDEGLESLSMVVSKKQKKKEHKKKKKKDKKEKRRRKKKTKEEESESSNHVEVTDTNNNNDKTTKMPSSPSSETENESSRSEQKEEEVKTDSEGLVDIAPNNENKKEKKKREKKKGKETDTTNSDNATTTESSENHTTTSTSTKTKKSLAYSKTSCYVDDRMVMTSALDFADAERVDHSDTTLLLFYQYVEPPWDTPTYQRVLRDLESVGPRLHLGGRVRCANEGLNCTLTGTHSHITQFCHYLRTQFPNGEFQNTEFKLTSDLPQNQNFHNFRVIPVDELVNYGLPKERAPPSSYAGVHLEPREYHEKLHEPNTVVIDVRNHYEAAIGRLEPQTAEYIDPKMRKSTEFPVWLNKESTKEQLRGKQVLMYCTGGVRCERASALFQHKLQHDPSFQDMDIRGVFQLQGGVDKYFKEFPDGGCWRGKNYTFDKRFAHAPPQIDGRVFSGKGKGKNDGGDGDGDGDGDSTTAGPSEKMGKCEACGKPWDMYRGKRRCPTCGVPSLICKDCASQMDKQQSGDRARVRCELCVEQGITSKAVLRKQEEKELQEYESDLVEKGLLVLNDYHHTQSDNSRKRKNSNRTSAVPPNPDKITRLFVKNMCRQKMTEEVLLGLLPDATHVVWNQRNDGYFLGQAWVEMASPDAAAQAVALSGTKVLGRPVYIQLQAPNGKDIWPPPQSAVK